MNNYQEQAKRTSASLGSDKLDLAHMALGMVSELCEVEDAIEENDLVNIGEELADICWYLANYCTFRGVDFKNICLSYIKEDSTVTDLSYNISRFSDLVKKNIAYNKEIQPSHELIYLKTIVFNIINLVNLYKLDFDKILQNNIDKLKVRFPDKFTEENAKNRNLDKELKELKK